MASRSNYCPPEKSLAQALTEFKDELKEFGATRIAILREEMRDKIASAKGALPAIAVGVVLGLLSVVLLSVALVALVAMAVGGGARGWAAAFTIVGGIYLLTGWLTISYGVRRLQARGLKPERTLRVLKQDGIWLRSETQSTGQDVGQNAAQNVASNVTQNVAQNVTQKWPT
jgi:hypothetical protein